ncbi:MAG TPA: hypothetical protein VMZ06_10880 [Candidatus Bathyarchaeia archaeon]|nr:hypothetical protein [Candidatus Bathyarchaeia archaeon]
MNKHIILGVHITDRFKHVPEAQRLFTEYGCNIKTRLGLHEVENYCSPNGIILLEMHGDEARCLELAEKLAALDGLEVQKMVFTHD